MLVIDASVVVDLCITQIGFDALSNHELVAPPLVRPETLSSVHALHWRGAASTAVIEIARSRLRSAPFAIKEPTGLADRAWKIAEELGWKKTYDAEYVALAQLLDCRLLTLDGRLRRGTNRLGFVITPNEL